MQGGEISLVDLFLQAGPVVKGVIIALALASLWCWFIIFDAIWSLRQLRKAIDSKGAAGGQTAKAVVTMFHAGLDEAAAASENEDDSGRRQRVVAAMKRRAQEIIEAGQGGLPNLAVIAAVAPFVGLFGTVWGIMASFAGIAEAKDTSLAVVAPGIAEALAATAIGLAAAIPAAFAYNRLAAAFGKSARILNRMIEDETGLMLRERGVQAPARRRIA